MEFIDGVIKLAFASLIIIIILAFIGAGYSEITSTLTEILEELKKGRI